MHQVAKPAGVGGDSTRQKQLGAFYTPESAVAYLTGLLTDLDPSSRILEPSGGDGAFVTALIAGGVDPGQIDVWDIDPACQKPLLKLGVSFTVQDTLLTSAAGQYTHVIGNPPYLSKQSAYIKSNKAALRRIYREIGAHDTYAMFIYRSLQLLAPGGQLVFLISDTFLTLGVHRKLRQYLLSNTTIQSITLLPPDLFPGAAVNTAVLAVIKAPADPEHAVRFVDARDAIPDPAQARATNVKQATLAALPSSVFTAEETAVSDLALLAHLPKLVDHLDGGLGMYTKNNAKYLAVVQYGADPARPGRLSVPAAEVDGVTWRFYHKRGGQTRWYAPAEHCVRWDDASRSGYGIPTSALACESATDAGFLISGVSSRLAARARTPGALWESNKVFGFISKDRTKHPDMFFVAVLNSAWYGRLAKALNHTVSLQIRDIQALPMLPFTDSEVALLARLADKAISTVKQGGDPAAEQAAIDLLVDGVVDRVRSQCQPSTDQP